MRRSKKKATKKKAKNKAAKSSSTPVTLRCTNPYCGKCGEPAISVETVVKCQVPITFINNEGMHITLGKPKKIGIVTRTRSDAKQMLRCEIGHQWHIQ